MKTCPKCNTISIPDDAKFCPVCGTPFDVFANVELKTLSFRGAFDWGRTSTIPCTIIISRYKVQIEWNAFTRILEFGDKPEIPFKYMTAIGVVGKRIHLLCIECESGDQGYFSSTSMIRDKNNDFVKRLAYIIELYRRMYWWYDEYKTEDMYAGERPIGGFENDVEDITSVSNEELIEFYKSL